jgi:hypothetical protein
MKEIVLLANTSVDKDIVKILNACGFSETKSTDEQIWDTHYIIVNKYSELFWVVNRVKAKNYINCIDGLWKPNLMEQIDAPHVLSLYPFRPNENLLRKLEKYRHQKGYTQSKAMESIVREFFKNNH